MSGLLSLLVMFLGAALIYAFRRRIIGALQRFEARNALRRAEEARALFDKYAHYRQTIQSAEEEIEPVAKLTVPDERTGEAVDRYLFLGVIYASRNEAEAVRRAAVVEKAREFYIDLDRIFLSRRPRPQPFVGASALPDPSKQETYTPPRG